MRVAGEAGAARSESEVQVGGDVGRIRRDMDATRRRLEHYLEEVERRRREITDVRLQARRHPALVVGLGLVAAVAVGGAVLTLRRTRERRSVARFRRVLGALGEAGKPPAPEAGHRLVGLFLKAGAPLGVALAKGLLTRAAAGVYRKPGR